MGGGSSRQSASTQKLDDYLKELERSQEWNQQADEVIGSLQGILQEWGHEVASDPSQQSVPRFVWERLDSLRNNLMHRAYVINNAGATGAGTGGNVAVQTSRNSDPVNLPPEIGDATIRTNGRQREVDPQSGQGLSFQTIGNGVAQTFSPSTNKHYPDGQKTSTANLREKKELEKSKATVKELTGLNNDLKSEVNRLKNAQSQTVEKLKMQHIQDLKDRSTDIAAQFKTQLNTQLAEVKSRHLQGEAVLEKRCEDLRKQLQALESQKGKDAGAHGLYVESGATPRRLVLAAEQINGSVQNFSRQLMKKVTDKEWRQQRHDQLARKGIKLSRPTDLRFVVQREVSDIAFCRSWASDSFYFHSLPVGSNISHSQRYWFSRYEMLLADKDTIPGMLANCQLNRGLSTSNGRSTICKTEGCSATPSCSCGALEFENFCHNRLGALQMLDFWTHVPPGDFGSLLEDFFAFLLSVWVAHLLALAFEQPACLFKVPNGQEFVQASMESSVIKEEREEDVEQAVQTVEFMIVPGFRVGRTVIKSQVYLADRNSKRGALH